jgi:hypothetical protein
MEHAAADGHVDEGTDDKADPGNGGAQRTDGERHDDDQDHGAEPPMHE